MSSDLFVFRSTPSTVEAFVHAYGAVGASVTGDLEYLAVRGEHGRFYVTEHFNSINGQFWSFFEEHDKIKILKICPRPLYCLTITYYAAEEAAFAMLNFPDWQNCAVHNDNGAVFSLEDGRKFAATGRHFQEWNAVTDIRGE